MAKVLAVEPFYGGSHQSFIDGLIERSRHEFRLLTLPPYFWKWRMRGAAVTMSRAARESDFEPDLVFSSDMLSLAEFKALYPKAIPSVLYMHENQLSYPAPEESQRDVHFGFTNLTSCLAADFVVWNSRSHRDSFLEALPGFLSLMPDHAPRGVESIIEIKSRVIYPGVDLESILSVPAEDDGGPPIILWNHRWEFDKDPEQFFKALEEVEKSGHDFRLAILGENFQVKPEAFLAGKERFKDRVVQFGFVKERSEYAAWLRRCRASVSCAIQENFGIAAVEAAAAGAFPIWPDRLSYPELLPPGRRRDHLYSDFPELVLKLKLALDKASPAIPVQDGLTSHMMKFDWSSVIGEYDALFEAAAES